MHNKDIIPMKNRDAERLRIIQKVIDQELTQIEAGDCLELNERQVRRLAKRVRTEGPAGIIHRNRGRVSTRRLGDVVKAKILGLIQRRYADFGPTLAVETMEEKGEARVSRETLRKWMIEDGLWQVRRKKRAVHAWRERKAHEGDMVQMDGSHHNWLEGRGPQMVLMSYIDDATGRSFGRFYEYEGVYPAMDSLRRYLGLYGRPESVYFDKHSTYKTTRQPDTEELLQGEPAMTQFERALKELEIRVIHAHSPQAKGRIERSYRTLQDRLVKAMRLEGIGNLEDANRFLEVYWPKYNGKFAKEPREKKDLHRRVTKNLNLDRILCVKKTRTINNGYLIKWRNRMFVVQSPSRTMLGRKVEVLESFDGRMEFLWNARALTVQEVAEMPVAKSPRRPAPKRTERKGKYIPPANHPWRHRDPSLHHNCYLERI
jgi:hypothetical protein